MVTSFLTIKEMNNRQITRLLCKHTGTKRLFKGVYSADSVPLLQKLREPTCYVVNVDGSRGPGTPWVIVYLYTDETSECFDSYGETCHSVRFCWILEGGYTYNPLRLQSFLTTACGQQCIFINSAKVMI